jgi:DNA-binding transcriptional regulator GbsR (MarR family)
MWHIILSEVISEVVAEPEVVGGLSEFFNSAFATISAIGVSGMAGITLLLAKVLPSKNFSKGVTDKLFNLEDQLHTEKSKVAELEVAQKEYQETNDELLMEIALNSPNNKVKELGKKLQEKKKELSLQQKIQDKVNEKTKELKTQVVSVLKKTE